MLISSTVSALLVTTLYVLLLLEADKEQVYWEKEKVKASNEASKILAGIAKDFWVAYKPVSTFCVAFSLLSILDLLRCFSFRVKYLRMGKARASGEWQAWEVHTNRRVVKFLGSQLSTSVIGYVVNTLLVSLVMLCFVNDDIRTFIANRFAGLSVSSFVVPTVVIYAFGKKLINTR